MHKRPPPQGNGHAGGNDVMTKGREGGSISGHRNRQPGGEAFRQAPVLGKAMLSMRNQKLAVHQ